MRIVFITNNTYVAWGGSEELWSRAALHLVRSGVPALVCVQNFRQPHSRVGELRDAGAKIHVIRPKRAGRLREKIHTMLHGGEARDLQLITVDEVVVPFRPDLVVVSQMQNFDGAYWARACHARGLAYTLVAQAASEFAWPQDWIWECAKSGLLNARRSFFVSRRNVELTERQFGTTFPNAELVSNPFLVDFDQPTTWPKDDGTFRLACVARLEPPSKGQDLLFRVLAQSRWRDRAFRVTLYGSGTQGASLRSLVAHYGLADKISFPGHTHDIAGVWREHHAVVLPSRFEGTPLALIEAMICHRLGVVTDVGGNAELVEEGVSGFVAESPTFEALDRALERAWAQRYEWREIGLAAGRRVRVIVPPDPGAAFAARLLDLAAEKIA